MKISEVMQQLRDEATRRHGPSTPADNDAAAPPPTAGPLPAPPTIHVTPLRDGAIERFAELERRARQKTEVSRRVPKLFRRFFRNQGGFNKEVLAVGKFLMKETREADKRLREIMAYLQAENGWFEGVTQAFAQVQRTLQYRLENQHSFERRLLAMADEISRVRSEALGKQSQLQDDLRALTLAVNAEASARAEMSEALSREAEALEGRVFGRNSVLERLSNDLDAAREGFVAEAKAREAAEQRIQAHHDRLDGLSNSLEAVREAQAAEARAREEVEERVQGEHTRLDAVANILEAVREALSAEAAAREGLATAVKEATEKVRFSEAERDRLSRSLQETSNILISQQSSLNTVEERLVNESSYLKRELHLHSQDLATLRALAGSVRGRKPAATLPESANDVERQQFDSFYLAFENRFRGTRTDIKQRVRIYVPFIKKARLGQRQSPVLDLGCGRGEWLELLRDETLVGHGIDLNEFMVAECTERKLSVKRADAIQHLATLPSDSQGAITAFHLVEHLPFPVLLKLFAESLRVLQPGGICIFETPNPDNIQVASNRFYYDPTHLHPLPHPFTEFVMSTVGFKQLTLLPLHPDVNAIPMTEDADPIERFAHEMFFGAQDYAVIGRK